MKLVTKSISIGLALFFLTCLGQFAIAQEVKSQKEVLVLTLDKAIDIALSENPTMKIAEKEIELKQVSNKETWQNLLPSASINASLDHTIKAPVLNLGGQTFKMGQDNSNTSNAGLSISLPLFAPSVYKAMSMTKKDIELSVEKSRESRLDLVNQVTKAYYQLLLAQDTYSVMEESYKLAQENFNVVAAKFGQGKVSEFDKISADVQVRSVKPSVVSAGNAVRLSILQLKVLMGITADVDLRIEDSLAGYETALFSEELMGTQSCLQNNTTLKQLDLNKSLLEKNIKTQRMSLVPTLGMSFNYQFQSLYNTNLKFLDYNWAKSSSLMFSLSIPLYKASNYTHVKTAKVQLMQLNLNRVNTERQFAMQAESFRNNMKASSEQVVSNRENMLQAEKAVEIAGKRYEVGKGTVLELNSSQVSLTQAQLTYNQSIFDYLVAKADLNKVLGVDYVAPNK